MLWAVAGLHIRISSSCIILALLSGGAAVLSSSTAIIVQRRARGIARRSIILSGSFVDVGKLSGQLDVNQYKVEVLQ